MHYDDYFSFTIENLLASQEEIFNPHTYEILYIIFIIGFGVTGYSMRNNKIEENSGYIVV